MFVKLRHQPTSLLTLAIAFLVTFGSTLFGQSEKLSDLIRSQEKATVILVSDGIETCEADPCSSSSPAS